MPNSLLPLEERNLTPDQVEALDKRRDLGHTFLVRMEVQVEFLIFNGTFLPLVPTVKAITYARDVEHLDQGSASR